MIVGVPLDESTKNGTLISKRTTLPACKDHNSSELVNAWCATKSSMTVICANKDLPGTLTSDTIQCNGEVCVDYFLTENDAQAQCTSSYMTWDNKNSRIACSGSFPFGGGATIDITVGATTYDVDGNPIQVPRITIYLNNRQLVTTVGQHNLSTILRDYNSVEDGDFESCFEFTGAIVTGYFAAFWG
ncbi:hypothetical protein C1646_752864 [Rhizophagus diaphanus]|nr:hypothetical protein C1646_752864 [Rhizophagus diaphanus] [Rhizophagus sp. MUCL 43196]